MERYKFATIQLGRDLVFRPVEVHKDGKVYRHTLTFEEVQTSYDKLVDATKSRSPCAVFIMIGTAAFDSDIAGKVNQFFEILHIYQTQHVLCRYRPKARGWVQSGSKV